MNKKQKTMLARILAAAALLVALHFLPLTGAVRFVAYLIPYLVVAMTSSSRRAKASATARCLTSAS